MPRVVRVLLRLPFQRRFLVVAALSLLATGMLAFTAGPALAGPIAPDAGSGSPNAEGIRQLYLIIFALGAVIFFGVGGLLIYTLIRFRAKKGAVAAQIHGSTRMEVSWTVGAALLLVVISVVTFAKLGEINDPPNSGPGGTPVTKSGAFVAAGAKQRLPPNGKSLSIEVNGQQYIWRYTYEDGDGNNLNNVYSYQQMVVPVDTTVTLKIRSQDVQHSWWIPALGGKFDAVPGYTNYTWFKATNLGTYTGQCAELCGRNHANMTAKVTVVPAAQFEAWYARQKADLKAADLAAAASRAAQEKAAKALVTDSQTAQLTGDALGKQLFVAGNPSTGAASCASCHTMKAAGAAGTKGPNLDKVIASDPASATLDAIVAPNTEIFPGYKKGVMPADYAKTLTKPQLAALVAYIYKSTHK